MTRLKRQHLRNPNPPAVHSDNEIRNSVVGGDNAMDGGSEPHSPARSVSESDIGGTPQSPSVSGFIIQPIQPVIAGENSPDDPKRSSARSGSNRPSEQYNGELTIKKKKAKKSSASASMVAPKPVAGGEDEEMKKSSGAIQRLWSKEDEIAILKGVIEFRAKTGTDPGTDAAAFLDFIKDSIHVGVSTSQLMSKVRKLKRKFHDISEKSEKGEDLVFNKTHDSTAFKLSKKIWGKTESNEETVRVDDSRKRARKSDSVAPEKRRGVFDDLADAAVAVAAAEANLNAGVLDDRTDMGIEKECNRMENGGSHEPVDDEIEMVIEKVDDGKENSDNGEAKSNPEVLDDRIGMANEKENGEAKSNPEVVDGRIGMVMDEAFKKSNPEVVDGRIEMVMDKTCHENGGRDGIWGQYPYLQDAFDTVVANGMVGELQKRLLMGKVGIFEGGRGNEWNDLWKAYRFEETRLQVKKHNLMAKFTEAVLDELNK